MDQEFIRVFKALGESTRMKIVKLLATQSMCVCELSEVLDMLQPRISQHMKVLKEANLVSESKQGYWIYYSLKQETLQKYWQQFQDFLLEDLGKLEEFQGVKEKIKNLSCKTK